MTTQILLSFSVHLCVVSDASFLQEMSLLTGRLYVHVVSHLHHYLSHPLCCISWLHLKCCCIFKIVHIFLHNWQPWLPWTGYTDIVALLVTAGADLNVNDLHYGTPLHAACSMQAPSADCIKFLLRAGKPSCNNLNSSTYNENSWRNYLYAPTWRSMLNCGVWRCITYLLRGSKPL